MCSEDARFYVLIKTESSIHSMVSLNNSEIRGGVISWDPFPSLQEAFLGDSTRRNTSSCHARRPWQWLDLQLKDTFRQGVWQRGIFWEQESNIGQTLWESLWTALVSPLSKGWSYPDNLLEATQTPITIKDQEFLIRQWIHNPICFTSSSFSTNQMHSWRN